MIVASTIVAVFTCAECRMTETFPLEKAQAAYERMMSDATRFRVVLTTGN